MTIAEQMAYVILVPDHFVFFTRARPKPTIGLHFFFFAYTRHGRVVFGLGQAKLIFFVLASGLVRFYANFFGPCV